MPEMPVADKPLFEEIMGRAVTAHSAGEYAQALEIRSQARTLAPADSSELGRALRDDAADYDRLEFFQEAEACAGRAFVIHDNLVENVENPGRDAYRERGATRMYLVTSGLRKIIHAFLDNDEPTAETVATVDMHQRGAWRDIQDAKKRAGRFIDRRLDQYEINMARRISMAATINGHRARGLRIGAKALALAPFSQLRWMSTAEEYFTRAQRLDAKKKAVLGGLAALGVGLAMTKKPGARQSWILARADRTL